MTSTSRKFVLRTQPLSYEQADPKPFPDFRRMWTFMVADDATIKWYKNVNLIQLEWPTRTRLAWDRATFALLWATKLTGKPNSSDTWALVQVERDGTMYQLYVKPQDSDPDGQWITFYWKDEGTFPGDVYQDESATVSTPR